MPRWSSYGGSDQQRREGWESYRLRMKALSNGFSVRRDRPGIITIVINPDPPDDADAHEERSEFIQSYPHPVVPEMSAVACTLLVYNQQGETFALGESSAWVWLRVEEWNLKPITVLYAGDDRNLAIQIAEAYNKKVGVR